MDPWKAGVFMCPASGWPRCWAVGVLLLFLGCASSEKVEPVGTAPRTVEQVLEKLHRGYATQPRLHSRPTLTAWAADGVTPVVSVSMSIDYDHDAQALRWTTNDMSIIIADGRMQSKGPRAADTWLGRPWGGSVSDGIVALLGSRRHVPAELQLYDGPPGFEVLGRIVGGTVGPVSSVHRVDAPPEGMEVLRVEGKYGTADITIDTQTWKLDIVEALSQIASDKVIQMEPIRTTIKYSSTCPDRFDPPIEPMQLSDGPAGS